MVPAILTIDLTPTDSKVALLRSHDKLGLFREKAAGRYRFCVGGLSKAHTQPARPASSSRISKLIAPDFDRFRPDSVS